VEDHAHCGAPAALDRREAVAHPDAVMAVAALVGALAGGEDHERAPGRPQHMGAALRTRALLHQDELAAIEVLTGPVQHGQDLEGEVDLPVEVLVQCVPVALVVAQDQRRRPLLPGLAAALQQLLVLERERGVLAAQQLRPVVGYRRQVPEKLARSAVMASGSG
jgi:hypothetical protein